MFCNKREANTPLREALVLSEDFVPQREALQERHIFLRRRHLVLIRMLLCIKRNWGERGREAVGRQGRLMGNTPTHSSQALAEPGVKGGK